MNSLNVLVAGGGIGGLTVALCLAQYGHRISVFEPGRNFDEVGAGIQLSPNCTRVLHHLGLEPAIRAEASLPQATHFRHWATGKLIAQSALGADAVKRYGMPYYHIHRGDLMRVLADAAAEHPNIILYTDARVEALSQHHGYVEVVVSGKSHQGEVLIGADGIHSVVRATLWGEEAPRFTGNIAWRALVPSERLSEGLIQPTATVWWGSEKHFVHYYVRSGNTCELRWCCRKRRVESGVLDRTRRACGFSVRLLRVAPHHRAAYRKRQHGLAIQMGFV